MFCHFRGVHSYFFCAKNWLFGVAIHLDSTKLINNHAKQTHNLENRDSMLTVEEMSSSSLQNTVISVLRQKEPHRYMCKWISVAVGINEALPLLFSGTTCFLHIWVSWAWLTPGWFYIRRTYLTYILDTFFVLYCINLIINGRCYKS